MTYHHYQMQMKETMKQHLGGNEDVKHIIKLKSKRLK